MSVLSKAHDTPQSGQLGTEKTFKRIALNYYWPVCFVDVQNYVRKCEVCQMCKVEQKAPPGLMGNRVVEEPWSVVATDIMGPFPRSKAGFLYVLVMQDLFTKWVECVPLRSATGKKIKESFQELIINRWGTPQVLHTDNGTKIINSIVRLLTAEFNIVHTTSPPYHPQTNPVERVNRVLKTMIVSFINNDHRTWDEHLSDFRFAYNTAHHSSIETSPAVINLGRNPKPTNMLNQPKNDVSLNIGDKLTELWKERMQKYKQ